MHYSTMVSVFTIMVFHIIAFLILLAFNLFIYIKAHKNGLLYSFLGVQGAFMVWILAKILKTVAPTIELRWFFIVLQYFGICVLEVVFLQFSHYYGKGRNLPKLVIYPLSLIAFIQFLIIATNEYHHLFYATFDFWGDSFGQFFYVHMGIMYVCIFIGIVIINNKFRKDFLHNRVFYEISLAIIIPLMANIFYLSGYYHILMKQLNWKVFDITPIAFELSLVIFAYAIYKKDFLNLMPIFEDEIIKHSKTGILLLDKYNNIIDSNNVAKSFLAKEYKIEHILFEASYLDEIIPYGKDDFFHVQKNILQGGKGRQLGYIITFMEVTNYIVLKKSIEEQLVQLQLSNRELKEKIDLNQYLIGMSTRNFVAREVHDILGHSMTITIKLLEIAFMDCEDLDTINEGSDSIKKRLIEAYNVCSDGYTNLRKSLIEKQELRYDLIGLKTEVNKMGKVLEVAGIEFNMVMTKESGLLTEKEYTSLKRFCQEGITNAIKHGKPNRISIDMSFGNRENRIKIMDNGCGCNSIHKGNGLSGLEQRMKEIQGQIQYKTIQGEGFTIELIY